jgi:rubrerythrin
MSYPISNEVYDLLTVLQNKLQALEAYDRFSKDMHDTTKQLLDQIRKDDTRHAELLANALETLARSEGLRKK